ncbi:MAG: hypothetical protein AAB089_00550 [Nitrospirota bacterium]
MKKFLILTLALVVLLTAGISSVAMANGLGAGLKNSPHDFSGNSWNHRAGEMCRVCHVPHDHGRALAIQTGIADNGLLWNRDLSTVTYTLYSSYSLTGTIGQPTGTAKMCLGCHDGTVALEDFDSNAGAPPGIIFLSGGYKVPNMAGSANNLKGTHPISVTYAFPADSGLNDPSLSLGTSGTITSLLDGGKLQCSTCHDVHDTAGEAVAGTHLLRVKNNDPANPSGLCVSCHKK